MLKFKHTLIIQVPVGMFIRSNVAHNSPSALDLL